MKKIMSMLLISFCLFIGTACGNRDEEASKYQTMIPELGYTYYAVAPDETEIVLNMKFFCPTSISKTELAETAFTLGDTGAIHVTKSEIMTTYDIDEADYYFAQMLLTLDVESMATDILSFNSLTYTVPGKDPQFLHLGPTTIDKHFAADQNGKVVSIEEQNAIMTPTTRVLVYQGYPDNPSYFYEIGEMYGGTLFFSQIRPVWQFTVDGQLYYSFQEEEGGMLQQIGDSNVPQEGGLKLTLEACQAAYAPYKEAYDKAQALRDTNPDPPSYDLHLIK